MNPPSQETREQYFSAIMELYRKQQELRAEEYLAMHSNNRAIVMGHINTICKYLPSVKTGRVLDWGCLHGVDSCLLRMVFGDKVDLYGWDFYPPGHYRAFHEYAGLKYSQLNHAYKIDYPDSHFDTVVGSGVLEHTANPAQSLTEVYRILKDEGRLILTYLPNYYSVTEFVNRQMKNNFHRRRFTFSMLRRLLLDNGFIVEELMHHEVTPTLSTPQLAKLRESAWCQALVKLMFDLNPFFEKTWPFNKLGQNTMLIARKANCV
jgi:SAM-dependent methyltransferase